jgi:hypothetical protein
MTLDVEPYRCRIRRAEVFGEEEPVVHTILVLDGWSAQNTCVAEVQADSMSISKMAALVS